MTRRRVASLDDFEDPILVVTAHPDDIEVHCGGTLAQLAAAAKQITCVRCTSGNRGTSDAAVTAERLAGVADVPERLQQRVGSRHRGVAAPPGPPRGGTDATELR